MRSPFGGSLARVMRPFPVGRRVNKMKARELRAQRYAIRLRSLGLLVLASTLGGQARAQSSDTTVKPYFLVIVDTSTSMNSCTEGSVNRRGEPLEFPNCTRGNNSCGQQAYRLSDARCV